MVGTNIADFESAALPSASETAIDSDADNQEIYVLLRPGSQLFAKFFAAFQKAVGDLHSGDIVKVAGFARDEHQFRVTVVVNLGPKAEVAAPSDMAVRGFNVLNHVFGQLSDYLPQYTFAPSEDEREQAEELLRALDLRASEAKAS